MSTLWSEYVNITTSGSITWPTITVPGITEKRNTMSTQVTEVAELLALDDGAKVIVRTDGTTDTTTWTVEEGHLCKEGARVPMSGFAQSILVGNVFLPGNHRVGQIFSHDERYFKIMARDGNDWVIAECDTRAAARSLRCWVGQPLGLGRDRQEYRANDILNPGWDTAYALFQAEAVQARLQAILDTGRIPEDKTYTVTVEVKATVDATPDEAMAKRMVGDRKITDVSALATIVSFTKALSLEKTSAWGCACDQVTEEDITVPGIVASWSVTGCVPTEEGVESTVHTAA